MSTKSPQPKSQRISSQVRFGIVAARFNESIVERLLEGCLARLAELGIAAERVETHRVPGALEIPVAAQSLARSGRVAAVICLGAVVRGDTPHFDYVAGQCAAGVRQVALEESIPVIFGVLTTNDEAQALARAGGSHGHAGQRAADAAVEMVAVLEAIRGSQPRSRPSARWAKPASGAR